MFGGWAHLATPPEDLTEKERTPPPAPTKLDFPKYDLQNRPDHPTSASSRHLFTLLCSLKRPQDITPDCLQALNLSVTPDVPFQDLLPSPTNASHNDPKQLPFQDRLNQTINELQTPQSAAFRDIIRLPPLTGQPRVRLTHTRKFWTGLERMSQYWDCSMDQFYDIPDLDDEEASSSSSSGSDLDIQMSYADYPDPSSAKLPPTTKTKQVYKGRRIGTGSAMPLAHRDETVAGLIESVVWAYNCQLRAPNLSPRLAVRNLLFPVRQSFIVGRLPKERDMARKGMLEGPVMGVCCRGETDFGNNHSDVEANMRSGKEDAWRETLDLTREAAVLLLLAQERAQEGTSEVKPGEGKWWTTVPRWGGGPGGAMENDLLTTTLVDGEEKLTTPPPPSNAVGDNGTEGGSFNRRPPPSTKRKAATPDDPIPAASSHANTPAADGSGSHHKKPTTTTTTTTTKPTQAEKWKTLKPGPGIWDRKMRYMRIGAPSPPPSRQSTGSSAHEPSTTNEKADRVFVVTSLNHHIALLSLDVSDRYLEWLAGPDEQQHEQQQTEKEDEVTIKVGGQQDVSQLKLHLKRTRWFDLFNEADRVEVVLGLWRVMAWLMRDSVEGEGKSE